MTQLGRHIIPQKEAGELANKENFVGAIFSRVIFVFSAVFLTMISTSQTVLAQSKVETVPAAKSSIPTLDVLPTSQNSAQRSNFQLQMPENRSKRMLDLNLDFDSIGCLVGEQNCLRDVEPVDVGFSKSLKKNSKKGLDVELVPTASVRFDDDSRSAVVGAVVRIGEDLRSKHVASNTCLLYTSPSPRDATLSRMPSSA